MYLPTLQTHTYPIHMYLLTLQTTTYLVYLKNTLQPYGYQVLQFAFLRSDFLLSRYCVGSLTPNLLQYLQGTLEVAGVHLYLVSVNSECMYLYIFCQQLEKTKSIQCLKHKWQSLKTTKALH